MLSIPMGKPDFPHSGNRVQKTFILSTQMHYFSDFLRERQWPHLGKQSRNGTGIPERAKLSWSPRKPRFSKTGISVRKSFVFCRWARRETLKNVVLEQYFAPQSLVHTHIRCPGAYPASGRRIHVALTHTQEKRSSVRAGCPPPSLPIKTKTAAVSVFL